MRAPRLCETVVPLEDPIITETTSTLQEWAVLWKQLYVVSHTSHYLCCIPALWTPNDTSTGAARGWWGGWCVDSKWSQCVWLIHTSLSGSGWIVHAKRSCMKIRTIANFDTFFTLKFIFYTGPWWVSWMFCSYTHLWITSKLRSTWECSLSENSFNFNMKPKAYILRSLSGLGKAYILLLLKNDAC